MESYSCGVRLKTLYDIGFGQFINMTAIAANGEGGWTVRMMMVAAHDIRVE